MPNGRCGLRLCHDKDISNDDRHLFWIVLRHVPDGDGLIYLAMQTRLPFQSTYIICRGKTKDQQHDNDHGYIYRGQKKLDVLASNMFQKWADVGSLLFGVAIIFDERTFS